MKKIDFKSKKNDHDQITPRTMIEPALFLLPFMIGIIIFTIYPFINVLIMSFKENYNMMTEGFTSIGLGNYRQIINDPNFINGLRNTGLYVLFVVPISTALSLLIASLLNSDIKFKGLLQTAYFLPMVTSITAVGLVWKWMFNFDYGLINYFLSLLGVEAINWLNNPQYNLP
jgi:multiple sugar transport system permease protein